MKPAFIGIDAALDRLTAVGYSAVALHTTGILLATREEAEAMGGLFREEVWITRGEVNHNTIDRLCRRPK